MSDPRPARLAVGYACGVVLARLASVVLPVGFGPLVLPLSALALPVLFVAVPGLAVRPGTDRRRVTADAAAVAAGVVADELVFVALRADGVGYWSPASVAGSLALAAGVGLGLVALSRLGTDRRPSAPSARFAAGLGAVVAACFVGFRASQEYFRAAGVPNAERSLVLAGHEIHHATTGSVVLVAGALLVAASAGRRAHRVGALVAAVGCGFVADQYPYVFLRAATDAAYFGGLSYAGGLAATGTVITVLCHGALVTRDGDSG
jgi:hypothetical protein